MGSSTTTAAVAGEADRIVPSLDRRLLLLATYLLYIVVNTVSAALMPSMSTDIGFSSGTVATIASAQTLAQMFGKMCWGGWPVSAFGGTRTMAGTMLIVGAFVVCYTLSASAAVLGAFVFCAEFFSTSTYACHVQIIKGHWSEAGRPDGFWLLGIASRSGDVLSKLGWGAIVGSLSWQLVCLIAGGVACGSAALALASHRDSVDVRFVRPEQQLTLAATVQIVRGFLSLRMFWVAAAAYSCTTMVKRTNELLMPTYFRDIGLAAGIVDDARAARLSAAWSAGVAASVFVGGHFFAKAAAVPGRQSKLMAGLLAVSTVSFALLAVLPAAVATESELWLRVILVFTGGTGIGAAYYIPAGMFSTKYGGENAGVLSCYLDAMSFLASAIFIQLLGLVVDAQGGWTASLWLLALAAAASFVLTPYFVRQLTAPAEKLYEELSDSSCSDSEAAPPVIASVAAAAAAAVGVGRAFEEQLSGSRRRAGAGAGGGRGTNPAMAVATEEESGDDDAEGDVDGRSNSSGSSEQRRLLQSTV
jgi:MFS family permease